MKRSWTSVSLVLLVCLSLAVAACGSVSAGSGGSSGGGGSSSGPAAQPTATPKPKPTAIPKITVAFCQGIMTVAQANQFMQPPMPATTIRVDTSVNGGSCNYEYKPYLSVVTILFVPFTGSAGDAQAFFTGIDKQQLQLNNATTTTTTLPGIGDAAQYVTGVLTVPGLKIAAVQVIYGAIFFACANDNVQGSSFAAQQTALTQVCQQFASQL